MSNSKHIQSFYRNKQECKNLLLSVSLHVWERKKEKTCSQLSNGESSMWKHERTLKEFLVKLSGSVQVQLFPSLFLEPHNTLIFFMSPLSNTPISGLEACTNDWTIWIRCVWLRGHTKCTVMEGSRNVVGKAVTEHNTQWKYICGKLILSD